MKKKRGVSPRFLFLPELHYLRLAIADRSICRGGQPVLEI